MKRKIRHLHVVVVLKQQKNVEKSVMHVQSRCFAFSYVLVVVVSLDLKVPSVNLQIRPESSFFFNFFHIFKSVNSQALVCMRKPNSEGFYKIPFAR